MLILCNRTNTANIHACIVDVLILCNRTNTANIHACIVDVLILCNRTNTANIHACIVDVSDSFLIALNQVYFCIKKFNN